MASEKTLRSGKTTVCGEPAEKKSKVAGTATRSSTEVFLVGHPSASISGSKLPTNRQALQYFLYLKRDSPTQDNHVIAYDTIDAIIPFWQMARIKTMTRQNAMLHFMKIHESHRKLARNKDRPTDPQDKRKAFILVLDQLLDIGAPDAIEEINKNRLLSREKKEEDIRFYQDQQNKRLAHMSGHDKVFEMKSQQLQQRREREEERLQRELAKESTTVQESIEPDEENDDESPIDDCDEDYMQEEPGPSQKDTMVTLEFPRALMKSEEICSAADRLSLSDNQTTAIVAAVLKAGGADLNNFKLSTSTTRRNRINSRYCLSQSHMSNFRHSAPKYCALHWDGKLLRDVLGMKEGAVESLAVLVSGSPEYEEGKLLGVPCIERSTGTSQSAASYDLLTTWGLTENVVALVFDTTASNSGVHKGAAKLLEEKLNTKVFYFACRHHILELLVGAAWEAVFGKIKSPDNPWFKGLKDNWASIQKDEPNILKVKQSWLKGKRQNSLNVLSELLESSFLRADYREVAELAVIVLGEEPPRGIHWSRPGAIHQARWMANNIYCIKMFLFSHELAYSTAIQSKLERIVTFLALFYTCHWMTATIAADAPINDLLFMKDMIQFRQYDSQLSTAVLNKMQNHTWYLTQEIVPFALFSTHSYMTNARKEQLALKIIGTEKPDSFRRGKPLFPLIESSTSLPDLVGPESHFLFDALGIDGSWLKQPVEEWPENESFKAAEKFVHSVKVVNDVAERGVKMMADFATVITTNQEQRDQLLQVVELHRRKFDSFKKSTLNE